MCPWTASSQVSGHEAVRRQMQGAPAHNRCLDASSRCATSIQCIRVCVNPRRICPHGDSLEDPFFGCAGIRRKRCARGQAIDCTQVGLLPGSAALARQDQGPHCRRGSGVSISLVMPVSVPVIASSSMACSPLHMEWREPCHRELIHGAPRHSVCKKLTCALVYNGSVRTAKTVGPMVRMCPFASLVLIIGGLAIGGHRTPFSRIRMQRIIGSEHPIQKQEV